MSAGSWGAPPPLLPSVRRDLCLSPILCSGARPPRSPFWTAFLAALTPGPGPSRPGGCVHEPWACRQCPVWPRRPASPVQPAGSSRVCRSPPAPPFSLGAQASPLGGSRRPRLCLGRGCGAQRVGAVLWMQLCMPPHRRVRAGQHELLLVGADGVAAAAGGGHLHGVGVEAAEEQWWSVRQGSCLRVPLPGPWRGGRQDPSLGLQAGAGSRF